MNVFILYLLLDDYKNGCKLTNSGRKPHVSGRKNEQSKRLSIERERDRDPEDKFEDVFLFLGAERTFSAGG